ncbi:hypothetical protein ACLKA7_001635 [Drosophila subpalustris]
MQRQECKKTYKRKKKGAKEQRTVCVVYALSVKGRLTAHIRLRIKNSKLLQQQQQQFNYKGGEEEVKEGAKEIRLDFCNSQLCNCVTQTSSIFISISISIERAISVKRAAAVGGKGS